MTSADTTSLQSNGILLLDKPVGVSSFQALYPVKRMFRGSKIGHAGTLDPAASGLLVIGIGTGTRLLEFLEGLPKSYRFTATLGLATDTYDLEGEVLERHDASGVTRADVEAFLDRFHGTISQLPPAYSAIKIQGKRACDRVRAGETVTMKPRTVRVDRLEVTSFEPGAVTLELDCSKGTYVRTIAHDLGQLLGCGAAAGDIRRLGIGPFRVEDAIHPDALAPDALLPLARAIGHLPAVQVKDSWIAPLHHGNSVPAGGYTAMPEMNPSPRHGKNEGEGTTHAVFSQDGVLRAIGEINSLGQLQPRKVLTTG